MLSEWNSFVCRGLTVLYTCDYVIELYTHTREREKVKPCGIQIKSALELIALRPHQFPGFFLKYLFIWLHRVLVAACGVLFFSCCMWDPVA